VSFSPLSLTLSIFLASCFLAWWAKIPNNSPVWRVSWKSYPQPWHCCLIFEPGQYLRLCCTLADVLESSYPHLCGISCLCVFSTCG
jgi:hypothetical protein